MLYVICTYSIFCKLGTFEVLQKKEPKNVHTEITNGISNKILLEEETNLEQSSNSFLDPAIAVADIDTFFVAEGQTVNRI